MEALFEAGQLAGFEIEWRFDDFFTAAMLGTARTPDRCHPQAGLRAVLAVEVCGTAAEVKTRFGL
jgi:ABC-type uncharacterized transport system substrate-binding protein